MHTRPLDVTREEETAAFVDWAFSAMGGLNGLINNAGILRDGLLVKRDRHNGEISKMTRADWQAVIDVNLTGATWIVRDAVAKMAETQVGAGVVVNILLCVMAQPQGEGRALAHFACGGERSAQ